MRAELLCVLLLLGRMIMHGINRIVLGQMGRYLQYGLYPLMN